MCLGSRPGGLCFEKLPEQPREVPRKILAFRLHAMPLARSLWLRHTLRESDDARQNCGEKIRETPGRVCLKENAVQRLRVEKTA